MAVSDDEDFRGLVRVAAHSAQHAGDDFYGALVPYALLSTTCTLIISSVADHALAPVLPVPPRVLSLVTILFCVGAAGWMGESVIGRWTMMRLKHDEWRRNSRRDLESPDW